MAKSSTLKLHGEITEASATALVERIESVPAEQKITIRIASPGGDMFAGTRIMTVLRAHKGGVDTLTESLAASMASAIFMLGSSRTMAKGSRLMIHKPWVVATSGASNDLRKTADLLDSLERDLLETYSKPTGLPEDRISAMLEAETWLDSEEALTLGFSTATAGEMKNAIPQEYLAKFEHVPAELLPKPETTEDGLPVNVVDLQASVRNLTGELQARTHERDDARAALAKSKTLLEALKRSYGMSAARTIVEVPRGEQKPILEQFDRLEGEAKTKFFTENKAAIMAAYEEARLSQTK